MAIEPEPPDSEEATPLNWNPLDINYPRALLVALTICSAMALVLAASTSGSAFSAYNPAWDGASSLQSTADEVGTDSELITNTSRYSTVAANGTVAVILSPDRGYTEQETARIRNFVAQGGTLIVAEDFGSHSNPLLDAIGANARFHGALIRDEQSNYRAAGLPIAPDIASDPATTDVSQLTLNYGTVIEPNGATPLANTSQFAYLDTNRNEQLDANETLAAYPVVTAEPIGAGRVIAVSDPSLFINAMLDRSGNEQFATNLFSTHDRVLFDYSHAAQLPPLASLLLVIRNAPLLQVFALASVVSIIGAWGRGWLTPIASRLHWTDVAPTESTLDDQALRDALHRRHPEWDEARVERLTKGVLRTRHNTDHDD